VVFFPDYAPELDDDTVDRLGISTAEDVLALVIVSLGANPAEATANLLAPLVINRHTLDAAQTVLVSSGYDVRTPLVRHEPR
jgi:flagellar assembly factor FliW